MPKSKYENIYQEIKNDIETGVIPYGEFLPSENEYTIRFDCTRNTIRRALSLLTTEGYLLPQHGRGVKVIYVPTDDQNVFTIGGIESFQEASLRNDRPIQTKVIFFEEVICDKKLSDETGFDEGDELFYIERVRNLHNRNIIFDTNIFLKRECEGLTKQIAGKSIYAYLENELGMTITTSRRRITAEKATHTDYALLDLDDNNFVMVVTGQVFNAKGIMFEYTQSRHCPDQVCFVESAVRQKRS